MRCHMVICMHPAGWLFAPPLGNTSNPYTGAVGPTERAEFTSFNRETSILKRYHDQLRMISRSSDPKGPPENPTCSICSSESVTGDVDYMRPPLHYTVMTVLWSDLLGHFDEFYGGVHRTIQAR